MAEPIISKSCRVCKQTKLLSEFYKRKDSPDGYRTDCKSCHLEHGKKYQKTERGKMKHRLHCRRYSRIKKNKIRQQQYCKSKKGKASKRRAAKQFRIHYPERIIAGRTLNNAIRAGILPRINSLQCNCGKPAKHYHHPSYAPEHFLDVIPLCLLCHSKLRLTS